MDIPANEQVKIQAQVFVPLLKAFQAELGQERANEIARKGITEFWHKVGQELGSQVKGSPIEKIVALMHMFAAGDTLDIQVIKQTPDALDINVNGCLYAQFYRELGEPELGFLMLCSPEVTLPIFESVAPGVQVTLSQTIMQGASHCDYRFRLKRKESQPQR